MRLEAIRAIQMISYNFYILEIEHFSLQHNDWHKYKIKNTLCGKKCTVLCTQTIRTTEFENYCLTIYLTNNILRRHNKIFIDKKSISLLESAACHVNCENGVENRKQINNYIVNKKKISVNIHHDNHSNTRLRP